MFEELLSIHALSSDLLLTCLFYTPAGAFCGHVVPVYGVF